MEGEKRWVTAFNWHFTNHDSTEYSGTFHITPTLQEILHKHA